MSSNRYTTQQWEAMDRARRAGVALTTGVYPRHERNVKGPDGKPKKGPGGKPKTWFYLDKAGEHLQLGAFAAGVEEDAVARSNWRLHQQPARAEHAYLRNEYFLRIKEDLEAENARRATIDPVEAAHTGQVVAPLGTLDLDELYGESCPEYPLFSLKNPKAPAPPARARGNKGYEWFIPDGRFTVHWPGIKACAYDIEVEMRARVARIASKVEKRVGWLRRLYEDPVGRAVDAAVARAKKAEKADNKTWTDQKGREAATEARKKLSFQGLPGEVYPVVFLFPGGDQARNMRDGLRDEMWQGRLPRYSALEADLKPYKRLPGWMFLFAGWDEVVRSGAHGRAYAPLGAYAEPDGGSEGVDLRAVALYRKDFVRADDPRGGERR